VVISVFAVIILGVIASLFHSGHESMVGRIDDPPTDAIPAVVSTISAAIFVYAVCTGYHGPCLAAPSDEDVRRPRLAVPSLSSLDRIGAC